MASSTSSCAGGRQRRQRDGFLDAKDARLRRTIGTAGIDEGLRFGNGHIGFTAVIADDLDKFQARRRCARGAG